MLLRKLLFIFALYFFYQFFRKSWEQFQSSQRPFYSLTLSQAYQEFDLHSEATFEDVKRQYRQLSKKHHPDNHKNSTQQLEKMQKINAAYSVLKKHFQTT